MFERAAEAAKNIRDLYHEATQRLWGPAAYRAQKIRLSFENAPHIKAAGIKLCERDYKRAKDHLQKSRLTAIVGWNMLTFSYLCLAVSGVATDMPGISSAYVALGVPLLSGSSVGVNFWRACATDSLGMSPRLPLADRDPAVTGRAINNLRGTRFLGMGMPRF